MPDPRLKYLLDQYLAKTCTAPEKQELAVMILTAEHDEAVKDFLEQTWNKITADEDMPEERGAQIIASILQQTRDSKANTGKVTRMFPWKKVAIAASIILMAGVTSHFLLFNKTEKRNEIVTVTEPAKDVEAPKASKATITLANGQRVYLDSVGSGQLAVQGNVKLVKLKNGQIAYQSESGEMLTEMKYNTLENPKGSKVIDMMFSDGSRVWLNAGSSVSFPVAFVGNDRKVSITGEAYFDIAHNEAKPFIVKNVAENVEVQVLGTQFNVNTYTDEDAIKVTLLKGSVKILRPAQNDKAVVIKPGQQAVVTDKINVTDNIDVEEVMAWKNGKFQFGEKMDIQSIMRQIARWYDVEIEYKGNVNGFVGGSISRNVNISNVIEMLEKTGEIKFKLEGKKITVMK
jgi:ferric-dicitrate binding protein FerR (iron transport regulator)